MPKIMNLSNLSKAQLDALISNHERLAATDSTVYIEALAERERRNENGLDFQKSRNIITRYAAQKRFLCYKDLADESGAEWNRVHYQMNGHLWKLVTWSHRQGLPMFSAIVVNKHNVSTGDMEPETLAGFINAAKELGYVVTDQRAFLKEQQHRLFDWAESIHREVLRVEIESNASGQSTTNVHR